MKKPIFVFLLLFAMGMFQTIALSQKVGSTSLQFLKVMPCARATAMGDAYSVLASGAEAVFWNPAGVANVENTELSLTYLNWIFDTQQGAFSFATSLGSIGTVGLQLQYVDFGAIDEAIWTSPYNEGADNPGLTGRTFTPYAYLVGISYAAHLTERFATGFTVKYAHESLYNGEMVNTTNQRGDTVNVKTWTNGLIFDFGIWYNTGFRSVKLGASVQNFGANVKYAEESNPLPLAMRVGIAADLLGPDALLMQSDNSRLGVAFDIFQPNDYTQQAHAGIEYEFENVVALRAGYKLNYDADGFTAGIGVKQTFVGTKLSVDYSYGSLSYNLGSVHRISIGAGF